MKKNKILASIIIINSLLLSACSGSLATLPSDGDSSPEQELEAESSEETNTPSEGKEAAEKNHGSDDKKSSKESADEKTEDEKEEQESGEGESAEADPEAIMEAYQMWYFRMIMSQYLL